MAERNDDQRRNRCLPGWRTWSVLLVLLAVQPAVARPQHLKALQEEYGAFLPSRLANCFTCHRPTQSGRLGETLADFPHNSYGRRLAEAVAELRTSGRRTDLITRARSIAGEDSDGDGVANERELLLGSPPGESAVRPDGRALARATAVQLQFRKFQAAYRWRPFEPVVRPTPPTGRGPEWQRNPVDAFIAHEQARAGVKPRPTATREVLLRRVYLDLIGLSPTPDELRVFVADRSPDAYGTVVDRLLADPRYGERWGRHWMDVWRYSDWTGFGAQVRDSQPHIWRWRDWIVRSLNEDKGYDRMLMEMLAGDELEPENPDTLAATGYLVRNFKLLSREKWLQDTVDHTGQAFLGLTVGCARCHDHRYDPITQHEYYQLRAVFEPHQVRTDWVPGEADRARDGLPRAYDAKPDAPTYVYIRGDERQPNKDQPVSAGVPEALGGEFRVAPVPLSRLARTPERAPHVLAALRADAARNVQEARKALAACADPMKVDAIRRRLDAAEAAEAALLATLAVEDLEDAGSQDTAAWRTAAMAAVREQRRQGVAEATAGLAEAELALSAAHGETARKKAESAVATARKALDTATAETQKPVTTSYQPRWKNTNPPQSTGRRLAFARWLTARENPLTARVAVNQIWMRHFGEGLVPSVADLGRSGMPPTHPALLDWLAADLMANGWSLKRLHRLIVTSRTYRLASTPDSQSLARDPDNRTLWRANSRRMDAEVVRDNVLYVCGRLDLTRGGPDLDQAQGLRIPRRTLYFRHAAEKEMVFTTTFDGPSVTECYARKPTIVPQQALALANSELALNQSRLLARRLVARSGPDPGRFVADAFLAVLARPATVEEKRECIAFLSHQTERHRTSGPGGAAATSDLGDVSRPAADATLRARENLVLVLLNHHDFVTVR